MGEKEMNTGREQYASLRALLCDALSEQELEKVDKAFNYANEAHSNQSRRSGEPYIIHPIAVAKILFELGMDADSITAALLHDVVEDTPHSLEEIEELFGSEIALLVDGVTKITRLNLSGREEQQAETLRKMLIAMSKDIRVIIIKLADRVHNMRTLEHMPDEKRREKSKETLEIYAPIAHRLGIRAFKEELEDLAIFYIDPVAYRDIEDKLQAQAPRAREFLEKIQTQIADRVHQSYPNAKIEGRIKSVHGIYRKMYIQNKSFDEIYDIYAVRIIVDDTVSCYNCLGVMHDMFSSVPGRVKDYINMPKPNMYRSLHTTLISPEGIPFEVQIRTWEMHREAEYGVAAHWKYKLGRTDRSIDTQLLWIRQMLEDQQDAGDALSLVQDIKSDLVPEEVYVLTPKGSVISLPSGSTVIDFAYAIHTEVGNRMIGAKVNGRIVPIDYVIQTGEIVEIITSNQQGKGPSRDWLNIVRTSGARSKIRSWFKRERRDENIIEGRTQIERELRRVRAKIPDDKMREILMNLAQRQQLSSIDDFYAAIGYGGISMDRIIPQLKDEITKYEKTEAPQEIKISQTKTKPSPEGIVVDGIDNCTVKLAKCCSPIPGDDIIGFVTRGFGVSIHKRDCSNVPKNIAESPEPERYISVHWEKTQDEGFNAGVKITCIDRISLLADISNLLSNLHVMILSVNTRSMKDGTAIINMTMAVNNLEHLKGIVAKLKKIKDVLKVERL